MPSHSSTESVLAAHIPAAALPYCISLWKQFPFELKIRKSRQTKVGDFTSRPGKIPRITVNGDSSPFLFLLTYVHEVAHLVAHERHGWRIASHGEAWKSTFRELLSPLMNEVVLPEELLRTLRHHMKNPKASSFSDPELTRVLKSLDHRTHGEILLQDIPLGSLFYFKGKLLKKEAERRTRVLCSEVNSRHRYLIPRDMVIGRSS